MRILRYVLLLFLILVSVALGAIWAALATEPGSRWLLQQAQPLVPGELALETFSGALATGFRATEIRWRNEAGMEVSLGELQAELTLWHLLHGQLSANVLKIADLQVQLPPATAAADEAQAGPPEVRLPLAIEILEGQIEGLKIERSGNTLLSLDRVALEDAHWVRRLRFERLAVVRDGLEAEASGALMLNAPHQLDLSLNWAFVLPEDVQGQFGAERLVGHANLEGTLEEIRGRHRMSAPFSALSTFTVQPFSAPLSLDVTSAWERIVIPASNGSLSLENGHLRLSGSLEDLVAEGSARATVPVAGTLRVEFEARGDTRHASALEVKARRGDARAQVTGSASWSPELKLDLAVSGQRIDPAAFVAGWPGELQLSAHLRGSPERIKVRDVKVRGRLRDRAVEATGQATLSKGRTDLQADLMVGSNRASVEGTAGEALKVSGTFDIDAPEVFVTAAYGDLAGRFALKGSLQAPRLDLSAQGSRLGFTATEVFDPAIAARDVGLGSNDFSLSLQGGRLIHEGNAVLDAFVLDASGATADHRLNWRLRNRQATVSGSAQGRLDTAGKPGWAGQIQTLVIVPEQDGLSAWRLTDATALQVAADRMQLERACLADGVGRLCGEIVKTPERLAVDATIKTLPLALLKLLTPELPVAIQGHLNAEASLLSANESWSGELHAQAEQAALVLENHNDASWRLDLDRVTANALLENDRLRVDGALRVRDHGAASLELVTSMRSANAPLEGNLSVSLDEWRWVSLFAPQVTDVAGALTGVIELAGTRQRPLLDGRLVLDGGTARIPQGGVLLSDIHLTANGDGRRIALSGKGTSGPGTFSLTGALHPFPASTQPLVSLAVNGERLEVVNLRNMHVLASPDLTLRLADEVLHVRGEVVIPEATITPEQPPRQAIQVSEDEVLVRERDQPSGPGLALDMKVTLILGEAVTFKGFGLETSPAGEVTLLQTPSRPMRLRGELRLEEGRYRAYGQNLQITEGQLLFLDEPANPGLNIRAVRRIPSANVEVGVEIGGTLRQPEAKIFSNPPMEESEAMAWLLTGRSLSGTSETENAQIAQALALYGLEKGSGITEEIGEKLGVDEISIGSTWETQDAALMLGKQLSDRLYLRYAAGLFSAVSTVMLRYTLSRRLHLEATTGGNEQSLDLIYQFEK